MTVMSQNSCLRTSAFIMMITVMLSVLAVSLENDFWSFWGKETTVAGTAEKRAKQYSKAHALGGGVAVAMPVPKSDADVADKPDDVGGEVDSGSDDGYSDDTPINEEDMEELVEEEMEKDADKEFEAEAKMEAEEAAKEAAVEAEPEGAEEEANQESGGEAVTEAEDSATDGDGAGDSSDPHQGFISVKRSRAKTFFIVFMGHSGSTAFITELRTHSEFEVEKLEPLDHGEYRRDTELSLKRAEELMESGIAKGKIPGFKIRPYHILNKPDAWRAFVKKYDTRVVWQYRENIMKQAIGEYRHRFLNDSSVVEGLRTNQKPCEKGSDQQCRIRIDEMKGLHGLMNDLSTSDELLTSAARALHKGEDMLVVKYEDYLYRRERTMRETFDFFGVDFQETAPQRLKASPDSLCEMVVNFQELCNHFHPCQLWRPYLQDDVNDCRCRPGAVGTFDESFCQRTAWYQ
eukprot:GFKZ01004543.1.p1 GENE.GFKZ01004543.1~~GFKZ01004543.1.p1  ORF type:complete len:461 (+),score=83.04 GFKZ01004543.1:805-2187(+)